MGVETALLVTTMIGAGISAYGSYREGMDAAEASRYNADVANKQADLIEKSGALDAKRQREQTSRLIGTQKAAYGGAGVELSGSPLNVMINSAANGELDANIIEFNTKIKANAARSQGAYDQKLAGIYETSGMTKAGTTLLTSASKIGTDYFGYGYKTPTPKPTTKTTGSY